MAGSFGRREAVVAGRSLRPGTGFLGRGHFTRAGLQVGFAQVGGPTCPAPRASRVEDTGWRGAHPTAGASMSVLTA